MLLKCPHTQTVLFENKEFCKLLGGYFAKIVKKKMDIMVKKESLRLLVSKINLVALEKFDLKAISKQQCTFALFLTSLLDVCVGIEKNKDSDQEDNSNEDETNIYNPVTKDEEESIGVNLELADKMPTIETLTLRGCNKLLVATVALYMLSYARNKQSNVFQITNGYFAYAHNASKRMVEVLHCIGLLVIYETICRALQLNALAIK